MNSITIYKHSYLYVGCAITVSTAYVYRKPHGWCVN